MRIILFFFILFSTSSFSFSQEHPPTISDHTVQSNIGIYGNLSTNQIKGKQNEINEPILAASILVYSNDELVSHTQTDFDGNYSISLATAGVYTIEFWYVGFAPKRIEQITVDDFIELNEKLVYQYLAPCIALFPNYNFFGDGFTTGQTLGARFIRHASY